MKLLFRKGSDELGAGRCSFEWRPGGNYIAIASHNQNVHLFDRKGELLDAVQLPGAVLSMCWDREGDVLAILHEKSSQLVLWDITTRSTEQIETSMGAKEMPIFVMWAPTHPVLVVGNNNGNLLIYNHQTSRKTPILGKHQRKVTCGAFSNNGSFACGSEDSTITISNLEGDTLNTLACSSEPAAIKFTEIKRQSEKGMQTDQMISAVLGKRILMLVNLSDTDNPINLQFQQKYGDIVSYSWYKLAYMVLGFEKGFIVCISAHQSEIGQEIFSVQEYKNYLGDVRVSGQYDKVMSVGDHQLKLREVQNLQDISMILDVDTEKELCQVDANADGQLLAVAGAGGSISVYLTKVPQMGVAFKDTLAILTNLNEVTVLPEGDRAHQSVVQVNCEPAVLAVGPFHVAVAVNNRVWFYDYINTTLEREAIGEPAATYEYLSTVSDVLLNGEYAAMLMDGSARLHRIIEQEGAEKSFTFPEPNRQATLVAAAITDDFFIFTTDSNYIVYFAMDEWAVVNEYRHTSLIRQIYPEPDGVRVVFFDERLETYVYSPVDDALHKLPAVGSSVHYKGAMWETFTIDRDTFVVFDQQSVYVFLLAKNKIEGEMILYIGNTKLPFGHTPLTLSKGIVHCLTTSGRPSGVLLETHKTDYVLDGKSPEAIADLLGQSLKLKSNQYT
ncbi:unnamed protein product, partial [Mesorhabditis spiculigera]